MPTLKQITTFSKQKLWVKQEVHLLLVLVHIKSSLPPTLDPNQFAYHQDRSTEDAISTVLHYGLFHLDNNNIYVRMLFNDFSIQHHHPLQTKLSDLSINTSLCNWMLNLLNNRLDLLGQSMPLKKYNFKFYIKMNGTTPTYYFLKYSTFSIKMFT